MTLLENDINDLMYRISEETQKRDLSSKDIVNFRYFSLDSVVGISRLYSLNDELDIQDVGNKMLFNFFKCGINSNGILKINKADWM